MENKKNLYLPLPIAAIVLYTANQHSRRASALHAYFGGFFILNPRHLYKFVIIAPKSHWQERVAALLRNNSDIPLQSMGFPEDWLQCPIWKNLEELGYGG